MEAFKHLEGSQGFRVFLDIWGDPKVSDGSQGFEGILKSLEKFRCFGESPGFWRNSKVFDGSPFWRDPRVMEGSMILGGIPGV